MIKVAIAGADGPLAGELIRLLALHPEVEVRELVAPSYRGLAATSIHRGLIGEQELRFCEKFDPEDIDLLFLSLPSGDFETESANFPEGLKVVYISPFVETLIDSEEWVAGLSEMFRKPLVRGAKKAFILPSPTAVALIVLFPLAIHLLLNDSLKITFGLPKLRAGKWSEKEIATAIEKLLKKVQLSFPGIREFNFIETDERRALKVEIEMDSSISIEEIEKMYEDIYDDHNFSYVVDTRPEASDVEGTQKCLIHISKPSQDKLRVTGTADAVMRGGAGDALHVMNLLFGLFEKIGLTLPASNAYSSNNNL